MSTEALAHLLACLDRAVECMDDAGFDIDARVVEAHRAELVAGREWPGQPISPSLSTADVARLLGLNPETVRRMARRGELQAYEVAGKWGFKPRDVDALAFAKPVTPDQEPEFEAPTPLPSRPSARGSVARLDEIERGAA